MISDRLPGVYLLINRDIRTIRGAHFRDTCHPRRVCSIKNEHLKVGRARTSSSGRYITATSRNVYTEIAMSHAISMIFRKVAPSCTLVEEFKVLYDRLHRGCELYVHGTFPRLLLVSFITEILNFSPFCPWTVILFR